MYKHLSELPKGTIVAKCRNHRSRNANTTVNSKTAHVGNSRHLVAVCQECLEDLAKREKPLMIVDRIPQKGYKLYRKMERAYGWQGWTYFVAGKDKLDVEYRNRDMDRFEIDDDAEALERAYLDC